MADEICECGKRRFDWVHETAILREDLELPGEHLIHPFNPVASSQSTEEAREDFITRLKPMYLGTDDLARLDALIEAVRGERGEKHIDYWKHEYDLAVEGWQQRGNQHEQALERIEQLEGALRRIDALDLVEMRRQGIDGDIGEAAQDIALAALAAERRE